MNKIFKSLDEYNLIICIDKLRSMLIERSILNHKLNDLIIEYDNLEKRQIYN